MTVEEGGSTVLPPQLKPLKINHCGGVILEGFDLWFCGAVFLRLWIRLWWKLKLCVGLKADVQ
jgi:hypothetical protein